jgi:hypothetical protein
MITHSLSVRFLISVFFILFSITAQANLSCQEAFDDSARLIDRIASSELKSDWSPQDRVFSDTLGATILNGVTWLTAVQVAKSFLVREQGQPIFTEAYMLTVPIDILLTVVSHYISLGKVPGLKKLLDGNFIKGKLEYWYRTAVNTLISSSVIVASWGAAGIDINSSTIVAAATLSAGVYATLQVTKPYLFQTLPSRAGRRDTESLRASEPKLTEAYYQQALEQAVRLGVDPKQIEASFVYALDSLVLRTNYESRITHFALINHARISDILVKIEAVKQQLQIETNQKLVLKLTLTLKNLRRKLVHNLLEIHSLGAWQLEIQNILKIDQELGVYGSLKLHQHLDRSSKQRQKNLYLASLADQAIAVGIAGGVLLYSTTHWAATGEIPLFLQSLRL